MLFVSEAESAALASHEMAREAVRQALIDACDAHTESFPVVHGHGSDPANRFTVKAAAAREVAGLKVGSYWPGNLDIGLPRHNSLILLFDQDKGRIGAAIEAGTLNAYRTAAADAVAAGVLARREPRRSRSSELGIRRATNAPPWPRSARSVVYWSLRATQIRVRP